MENKKDQERMVPFHVGGTYGNLDSKISGKVISNNLRRTTLLLCCTFFFCFFAAKKK